jgi:hypothetical protein
MPVLHIKDSESLSLPTLSASQEPGWTVTPVDKDGNPTTNPNERWYHPETGRLMQKGVTQALMFALPNSALLRSPTASQGQGGALGEAEARKRGNTVGIRDQAMDLAKLQGHKVSREVDNLFPTPNTMEHREVKTPEQIAALKAKSPGGYRNLRESVMNEIDPPPQWGKFEPAIRRWESIIGRPAPEPTKPDGKDGNHRLSSKFTEWMMGLPDGWITGHDLKRNDELKLAGNGVVPQQAELALRLLLELPEER